MILSMMFILQQFNNFENQMQGLNLVGVLQHLEKLVAEMENMAPKKSIRH